MSVRGGGRILGLAVVFAATVTPVRSSAQASLSVSAGAAPYDLSGTGTSGAAAVRVDVPVARILGVQVGPTFFWYGTQGGDAEAMLIPELGVVLGGTRAPVYLAVGGGHTLRVRGDDPGKIVLYAGLGAQIEDRAGWAVRPELRVRSVDPWAGTIAEFAVGVRRTFVRP